MRASDIMTDDVVCLEQGASVFEAAELMVGSGVSALPVVDDQGRMVGILSEADLLRRAETGTTARGSWLSRLLADRDSSAHDFVQAHARRVADVMTRDVVTAGPDTGLAALVGLLEKHRIKRLPIVDEAGQLIGIVSRANLLGALLSRAPEPAAERASDEQLREAVIEALKRHGWTSRWPTNVFVQGGVVHLWGFVAGEDVRRAYRVAAENVPGVKRVKNHLRPIPGAVALEL